MAQTKYGAQFDKRHATTIIATLALAADRFIAYDGGYATAAGGVHDAQGVSEHTAAVGDPVSCITSYSATVTAAEAIPQFSYVKPATDGTGRAAVGSATEHCGRALGEASEAGQLVEVQVLRHIHP